MRILVFGSNLKGIHGAGAALLARRKYGALQGVGDGPAGNSYAIPTKLVPTRDKRQLDISWILERDRRFLSYARQRPHDTFLITRIGCGLGGYTDEEMAPGFYDAPENCEFDPVWLPWGLKSWKEKP